MNDTITLTAPTNTKQTTVKFNVGGKVFEISRSLLDSFPETMIYKAASETWMQENSEPIFIERDCDRFHYVLDYMRDGYCSLPYHTTIDAVLNELSYFGFDKVDPEKMTVKYYPSVAASIIATYYQKHPMLIKKLGLEILNLNREIMFTNFAFACFDCYIKTSKLEMNMSSQEFEKYGRFVTHNSYGELVASTGPSEIFEQNSLLKKCAAEFDLEFISTAWKSYNKEIAIKFGFSQTSIFF